MNSNFATIQNLKLFSIRVEELLEPSGLLLKKGFYFFKGISGETDLRITPAGFTVQKSKIRKADLHLTVNQFSKNIMWCAADNHNYRCHIRRD